MTAMTRRRVFVLSSARNAMSRRRRRTRLRLTVTLSTLVVLSVGLFSVLWSSGGPAVATTTTTVPAVLEKPEAGWTVVGLGGRGVLSDRKTITVSGVPFTVARFRSLTTRLNWHPGTEDPPNYKAQLPGYSAAVDFSSGPEAEGLVAAFNGAFKLSANAGGLKVGAKVLAPFVKGYGTVAIDADGYVRIFPWNVGRQPSDFAPVIVRQNLPLMVDHGKVTSTAQNSSWTIWGATLHGTVGQSRTALGIDAKGNVIYVAAVKPCLPVSIAQAMVQAGVVTGIELDINPYWPILGMATSPLLKSTGNFGFSLPGSMHNPHVFLDGWIRDFFTVSVRRS